MLGQLPLFAKSYLSAPTVIVASPSAGPVDGGNTVVIAGTGFIGIADVSFGGTPTLSFTIDSSSQITAVVDSGAFGNVNITVTNAAGTGTLINGYEYVSPKSFSNLIGWYYDGSSIATDGSGISTWSDASGNNFDLSISGVGDEPSVTFLDGKTSLQFDDSSHYKGLFNGSIAESLPLSIYLVYQNGTTGGPDGTGGGCLSNIWGSSFEHRFGPITSSTNNVGYQVDGLVFTTPVIGLDQSSGPTILCLTISSDGSAMDVYVTDPVFYKVGTNPALSGFSTSEIDVGLDYGSLTFNGIIGEYIIVNDEHDQSARTKMMNNYLKVRWGIT